jgi:eukaryotic-like serine/threonine-protein kinase
VIETETPVTTFSSQVEYAVPPRRRVERRASSTSSLLGSSPSRDRALPDDLLRDASRRLGIISLVGAVLWIAGTVLGKLSYHHLFPADTAWKTPQAADAIAIASVLASLALFAYSRRHATTRDPRFILDLGLAYQVFTALAIGLNMHWYPVPPGMPVVPEISWIGAVILMFAAIVPNDPKKTLVAGLIAATMNPLGMLIAHARGSWEYGAASNALLMHYPDFLLVGVAVVISHVMTKLGHQVTKAREMGSYRLGELLGSGGMGEVYRATHRMLARPAAIKLIRPAMLGALDGDAAKLAVTRFHREAEAAANLRSPHTVELYDFGVTEDDTLYFVMELLDGMDLESLVRKHGPVPANRAIHIVRQVCESLEEAHAQGLVHRDIKPANIHVGRLGLRYDFVKVLDFGLVKVRDHRDVGQTLLTADHGTTGTPAYMAPEVILGEADVDRRADVYALGCVAYYMLTGQLVFEADTPMKMLVQHVQSQPVPPSQRTELKIPRELDQLVLSCLEKNPANRPRDAEELFALACCCRSGDEWEANQAREWWEQHLPEFTGALAIPGSTPEVPAAGMLAIS